MYSTATDATAFWSTPLGELLLRLLPIAGLAIIALGVLKAVPAIGSGNPMKGVKILAGMVLISVPLFVPAYIYKLAEVGEVVVDKSVQTVDQIAGDPAAPPSVPAPPALTPDETAPAVLPEPTG